MAAPPRRPLITCPYCGFDDEQSEFFHPDDIQAALDQVGWAVTQDVMTHLEDIASNFNRTVGRGGLISMSMKVDSDSPPRPFFYRQDLLRHLQCDCCGRHYGVYAIGLFCPDCGAPNMHVHFLRECELIELQIKLAAGIEEQGGELAYRVLGNSHEDVVTALETYLKTAYRFIVMKRLPAEDAAKLCSKNAIGNRFQNIARTRELFAQLAIDPYAHLQADALETLRANLEKRHVLGHNLGLVDAAYAERVQAERIGETVGLVADEIRAFAAIARGTIERLEQQPEFQPSPS